MSKMIYPILQTISKSLRTTCLVLLLACTVSIASTDKADAGNTPEESAQRVYQVYGMDCPGCHGGLEKLVNKIPEVKESKANFKEQQLVVTIGTGKELNDEVVYDAIRRSNFTPGKRIK